MIPSTVSFFNSLLTFSDTAFSLHVHLFLSKKKESAIGLAIHFLWFNDSWAYDWRHLCPDTAAVAFTLFWPVQGRIAVDDVSRHTSLYTGLSSISTDWIAQDVFEKIFAIGFGVGGYDQDGFSFGGYLSRGSKNLAVLDFTFCLYQHLSSRCWMWSMIDIYKAHANYYCAAKCDFLGYFFSL